MYKKMLLKQRNLLFWVNQKNVQTIKSEAYSNETDYEILKGSISLNLKPLQSDIDDEGEALLYSNWNL